MYIHTHPCILHAKQLEAEINPLRTVVTYMCHGKWNSIPVNKSL